VYVRYGLNSPLVQQLFAGIQAAVIALIVFAVYRIGKHAVVNSKLLVICLASGLAFFLGVNFLFILPLAGLAYVFWQKRKLFLASLVAVALVAIIAITVYKEGFPLQPVHTGTQVRQAVNKNSSPGLVFLAGLKTGSLTFGGAYTAIPFLKEDAVEKNGWMSEPQFLDGIALSGILPAPLIIFSTFVGYFGGGWLGAILITVGVFLPAFLFTLIGHRVMENLMARTGLHNFLDGIAGAVVGLIGVTAIQLFISKINNIGAVVIFIAALLLLIKYRSKYTVLLVIAGAGLLNLLFQLFA
jgi:chromate transporter